MRTEFLSMLDFVEKYLPNGFRIGKKLNKTTTRIKFESIAIGITLALRQNLAIKLQTSEWLNSKEFKDYTKSDGSSSKNKVIRRIEYVRDQLLANS